jgi:hypothetical protein
MRVLAELITLLWRRGAISLDHAHYFVEHGFVKAADLHDYQPREKAAEEDDGESSAANRPRPPLLLPDELEEAELGLAGLAGSKRKRKQHPPRVPDLTPEELGARLEALLHARVSCWPALVELSRPHYKGKDGLGAAVILRQFKDTTLMRRLLAVVRAEPRALAHLWEAVDSQPFHDLVEEAGMKGKAARAFEAVLRSVEPGQWGSASAWILQVPAVQAVTNLLAVRQRLLPAVTWLYDNHRTPLGRSIQRPPRPRRSWDGLGFGLVLLYNARARLTKRPPPGFPLVKRLSAAGWREAWANAMSLDPAAVTPYLIQLFGMIPDSRKPEAEDLSAREDVALICPHEWKV